MISIEKNIAEVRERIRFSLQKAGREGDDVTLVAVTKTQPAEAILAAYQAGLRHFGENYLQEALGKRQQLLDQGPIDDIIWHYIGPIQSNKTRDIAENFDWVHSVDRLKIAQRLNDQRGADQAPLQLCLQVNIDNEPSKSGVAPQQVLTMLADLSHMPRLRLRGLMAIPQPGRQASFADMQACFAQAQKHFPTLDTLSMGMSGDIELAIAAGANMVRVGTALFGERRR
ncbi:YggS family pyridoxal phosphate-dependent enzyme [bacterium]|nr:YggS family pyridoxal phosphate-dependent enzyme [bacterium]